MATIDSYNAAVVAAFEEARENSGVSYRTLSERTGINKGTLSKHLTGKHSLRVESLHEMCAGIGVEVWTVLRRAEELMEQQTGPHAE